MSLLMLVTGIDPEPTNLFHEREGRSWAEPKDALLAEFQRAGVDPSYGRPTIFKIHDDLYAWMINHEPGRTGRATNMVASGGRAGGDSMRRRWHES